MNSDNAVIGNTLHAAEAWLQRIGADPAAVAVITVAPRAAVGVWVAGQPNVGRLAAIDEFSAELCEATAPCVENALARLDASVRKALHEAMQAGACVQLLAAPATGELVLRVHDGVKAVALVAITPGALH